MARRHQAAFAITAQRGRRHMAKVGVGTKMTERPSSGRHSRRAFIVRPECFERALEA